MAIRRSSLGLFMIVVGWLGVATSVLAFAVGQHVVGNVDDSVDDTLALTGQALSAASDSVTVTKAMVDTVRSSVATVSTTLDTLQGSVDESAGVVADVGELTGGALPQTLDAISQVMPAIQTTATSIDEALRVLSRAPFGPDYNPAVPFDEAIGKVADAIGPLPAQMRELSTRLSRLGETSTAISTSLATMHTTLQTLDSQLADVSTLLDRYTATATSARVLAARSRNELASSIMLTRFVLAALAIVFGLGQAVPIWLGTQLRKGAAIPLDEVPEEALIT